MIHQPSDTHRRHVAQSSHFSCKVYADHRDRLFDIVSKKTGRVIASLPFRNEFQETRFDALLLMAALDRFIDRGGLLHLSPFKAEFTAENE